MKGLFYKDRRNVGFEIMSEVMCVRNEDGYDEVVVVIKRLDDNKIAIIDVIDIEVVMQDKKHIGY